MTTDDPGARSLVLKLEANVVAPVKVLPRRRVYLGVVEGEKAEVRLVLRRKDGTPIQVKDVKVRDPGLVGAHWEKVTERGQVAGFAVEPGDVVLVIESAARVKGTSRATVVEVSTDVPEEPVVRIPVSVRVRPRIQVSPPQAHLVLPSQGGAGTVRMVRLASTTGQPFRITGVDNDRPTDLVVEYEAGREAVQHTLTLRVTEAAASKELGLSLRGNLLVKTDDPKAPEIRVPFVVERRRGRKQAPGEIVPRRLPSVPTPPGGRRLKAPPGREGPVGTPVPVPSGGGNG